MTKTKLKRFKCNNCNTCETLEEEKFRGVPDGWSRIPDMAGTDLNVDIAETAHLCPDCVKTLRKLVKPELTLVDG